VKTLCLNQNTRLAGEPLRFVREPNLADDLRYIQEQAQFRSLDPAICKRVRAHIADLELQMKGTIDMATNSQSPQSRRGSSQDHEQFSKGDVQTSAERLSKSDAANSGDSDPWQHLGETVSTTYEPEV
jgi:hypothetical protein